MRTPDDLTRCPKDFSRADKALYAGTRAALKKRGVWQPEYSPLLERYVGAVGRAREALARIMAREAAEPGSGWVTLGDRKQLVQHPDVKTLREAERDADDRAKSLLLTPADRAKLGDVPTQKPEPGKFQGAFG